MAKSTRKLLEESRKLRDESRVLAADAKATKEKTDEIIGRSNLLINHSKSLQCRLRAKRADQLLAPQTFFGTSASDKTLTSVFSRFRA
jgi:hypothetical protein